MKPKQTANLIKTVFNEIRPINYKHNNYLLYIDNRYSTANQVDVMTQRKLTRTDVAMILELRSCGIALKTIAYYVWGIKEDTLRGQLKTWKAI